MPIVDQPVGASYQDGKVEFIIWAPYKAQVTVEIISPKKTILPLEKDEWGYWKGTLEKVELGIKYMVNLDEEVKRPDPASRCQPDGVHEASEVVGLNYKWSDKDWNNLPLAQQIQYELHIGTFTADGTFEAAIDKLDYLIDLGVNAIEIMPVAQFPGSRNWGYDGVYPFAVQNSYGGAKGLQKLVNACHQKGMAVILDVVYNHLGPEGNYLKDFGPYFTGKYHTPWGKAINFDDPHSDHVRNFFIQNALMWFRDFHIDALRLDAIHAIFDMSAKPFLQELAEKTAELSHQLNKPLHLIAESDLNDSKIISSQKGGGYGLPAQWLDDFHHAVHALGTGENMGYYEDFGKLEHLKKCYEKTFVYDGIYSKFRKKTFGSNASNNTAGQFVAFTQNHDQVGNRMLGERLNTLVSFEMHKTLAGILFCSPYVPMLFMGQEYGETNPFFYFISHTDRSLVEAVRQGRKREFKAFQWQGTPPDPFDTDTYEQSKLSWQWKEKERKALLELHKKLIQLKKAHPVLSVADKKQMNVAVNPAKKIFKVERWQGKQKVYGIFNFSKEQQEVVMKLDQGHWKKLLDSADKQWQGSGVLAPGKVAPRQQVDLPPESFVLYEK